jgi:hypothetical protein
MTRLLALGLAAILVLMAKSASAAPLDAYRGKARPVLVFGAADSSAFRKQIEAFNRASEGLRERDVVIIPVPDRSGQQGLQSACHVAPGDFQVLLIGKDGGVKLRSGEAVAPEEIFGLVDAMPMRRQEMRSR